MAAVPPVIVPLLETISIWLEPSMPLPLRALMEPLFVMEEVVGSMTSEITLAERDETKVCSTKTSSNSESRMSMPWT